MSAMNCTELRDEASASDSADEISAESSLGLIWRCPEVAGAGVRVAKHGDRKSTRLNSSHLGISYAVFCLNDTATTEIYTLSLHDAFPIYEISAESSLGLIWRCPEVAGAGVRVAKHGKSLHLQPVRQRRPVGSLGHPHRSPARRHRARHP